MRADNGGLKVDRTKSKHMLEAQIGYVSAQSRRGVVSQGIPIALLLNYRNVFVDEVKLSRRLLAPLRCRLMTWRCTPASAVQPPTLYTWTNRPVVSRKVTSWDVK